MEVSGYIYTILGKAFKNGYFSFPRPVSEEIKKELSKVFDLSKPITVDKILNAYENNKDYFNSIDVYFNTNIETDAVASGSKIFFTKDGEYYVNVSECFVYVYNDATVHVNGYSEVSAFNNSKVFTDIANVDAFDKTSVFAGGEASVYASDNVNVFAGGEASVYADGCADVSAHDSAKVEAYGSAKVQANNSAKVG